MTQILIFIGAGVGILMAWVWCNRKYKELKKDLERTQREMETERKEFGGLGDLNKKLAEIKEKRKEKITTELKSKRKIQTSEVADLLDISRATAFRYLEELEKEGVIEQVGKTGRDVEYRIRQK